MHSPGTSRQTDGGRPLTTQDVHDQLLELLEAELNLRAGDHTAEASDAYRTSRNELDKRWNELLGQLFREAEANTRNPKAIG